MSRERFWTLPADGRPHSLRRSSRALQRSQNRVYDFRQDLGIWRKLVQSANKGIPNRRRVPEYAPDRGQLRFFSSKNLLDHNLRERRQFCSRARQNSGRNRIAHIGCGHNRREKRREIGM